MDRKKNPKYDLERFRALFFSTALVMVLILAISIINVKQKSTINPSLYSAGTADINTDTEPETGIGSPIKLIKTPEIIVTVDDREQLPDTAETEEQETGTHKNSGASSNHNPLYSAEIMPEYPGGMHALRRDLAKIIKLPSEIKSGDISGTLYVQFVVNQQGRIEGMQIKQSLQKELDNEVLTALTKLKKFTPASQNGQPVAVYFILPLSFNL